MPNPLVSDHDLQHCSKKKGVLCRSQPKDSLTHFRGFLFLSFTLPAQDTRDQGRKSRKTGRCIADKMESLKDEARRTLLRTWLLLNLASLVSLRLTGTG